MGGGAHWGGGNNFHLIEEKHEEGYCLELWSEKAAKLPIKRGADNCFVYEWIKSHNLIERLTVLQAKELVSNLGLWIEQNECQAEVEAEKDSVGPNDYREQERGNK